jgi:hypothetical protein
MPLYESENEIEAYLRNGNPEERIYAICSIDSKKENYERFWEIFISDTNSRVKGNALCGAVHSDMSRIWEIIEYILENEYEEQFLRIILVHLLEQHKKEISGGKTK